MEWQPIETCPEGVEVLLYQPSNDDVFRPEAMIIGMVERNGWERRSPPLWVTPSHVDGYEWECECNSPTHWAPKPKPPLVTDR